MGLNAIAAAARARQPLEVIATAPETRPAMADATRAAGMRGWEGELSRRAEGASLEEATAMLRWWPPSLVRVTLATARSRPGYATFLRAAVRVEAEVADRLLGAFAHLEGLQGDLEWLAARCDPAGRPQLAHALRRRLPEAGPSRVLALARALALFRDDCALRAWERLGLHEPLHALALDGSVRGGGIDPAHYGWSDGEIGRAQEHLMRRGYLGEDGAASISGRHLRATVEAETDALAADPWETMTESRRTRALGVVEAAADRIAALPR